MSEATHLAVRYHASTWQRYREECERRNLEECRIPFCSCRLSPRRQAELEQATADDDHRKLEG